MRIGVCAECRESKELTKHSTIGYHLSPYIKVCRDCHDKIHGMNKPKWKPNSKYQKGTPQNKRK